MQVVWFQDTKRATQARPKIARRTESQDEPDPRLGRPARLILFNDPINGFGFVVGVLADVLGCSQTRAFWLTLKVHTFGRGTLTTGTVAQMNTKAGQIRARGPDPERVLAGARPLAVAVEPLPA